MGTMLVIDNEHHPDVTYCNKLMENICYSKAVKYENIIGMKQILFIFMTDGHKEKFKSFYELGIWREHKSNYNMPKKCL